MRLIRVPLRALLAWFGVWLVWRFSDPMQKHWAGDAGKVESRKASSAGQKKRRRSYFLVIGCVPSNQKKREPSIELDFCL